MNPFEDKAASSWVEKKKIISKLKCYYLIFLEVSNKRLPLLCEEVEAVLKCSPVN